MSYALTAHYVVSFRMELLVSPARAQRAVKAPMKKTKWCQPVTPVVQRAHPRTRGYLKKGQPKPDIYPMFERKVHDLPFLEDHR